METHSTLLAHCEEKWTSYWTKSRVVVDMRQHDVKLTRYWILFPNWMLHLTYWRWSNHFRRGISYLKWYNKCRSLVSVAHITTFVLLYRYNQTQPKLTVGDVRQSATEHGLDKTTGNPIAWFRDALNTNNAQYVIVFWCGQLWFFLQIISHDIECTRYISRSSFLQWTDKRHVISCP